MWWWWIIYTLRMGSKRLDSFHYLIVLFIFVLVVSNVLVLAPNLALPKDVAFMIGHETDGIQYFVLQVRHSIFCDITNLLIFVVVVFTF